MAVTPSFASSSIASEETDCSKVNCQKHILIGCTGSVASLKVPVLEDIEGIEMITDVDEWNAWNNRGDPVIHIELTKWADLLVIAPLDANTLGKIASGLCDNLLTCIVRAWSTEKPLLFCPAMNTKMYEHPITSKQISTLTSWGYREIPVVTKVLVCGDKGAGAMAEVDTIVEMIINCAIKS